MDTVSDSRFRSTLKLCKIVVSKDGTTVRGKWPHRTPEMPVAGSHMEIVHTSHEMVDTAVYLGQNEKTHIDVVTTEGRVHGMVDTFIVNSYRKAQKIVDDYNRRVGWLASSSH
jgi:hypothetical protein